MTTMTKNDTATTATAKKAPTGKNSVTGLALPVSNGLVTIDRIHVNVSGRKVTQPELGYWLAHGHVRERPLHQPFYEGVVGEAG